LKVAIELESGALRADAAEAIACGWLSLVVILDLLGQLLFHIWWLDPIASLAIVWFLLKEGHEAWNVEHCAHE
jgi:divalent metal cation (Fe/Co/Zn/Cd) transporter